MTCPACGERDGTIKLLFRPVSLCQQCFDEGQKRFITVLGQKIMTPLAETDKYVPSKP